MMQSMTGFARHEIQHELGLMVWEIRSVNHRYLEVSFRMPEEFRPLELRLRKQAQARLQRGKIDCSFRYNALASEELSLELNARLMDALLLKVSELEQRKSNLRSLSAIEILQWPGIVQQASVDQEVLDKQCSRLFEDALATVVDNRQQEGARIAELISERCSRIQSIVNDIRLRRQDVMSEMRKKTIGRLEELRVEIDQQRLEQELVYLAQKLDVDEELDRLDSHLTEAQSILNKSNPAGRRLDFLLQEFNREANTLGSKSADIQTTQAAVDMKVLIEQMREQVQNLQ